MTLRERLTEAHARAAQIYLKRQEIEAQRQQLTHQAQACELALAQSDGEVQVLTRLIADEEKEPQHGV